MLYVVELLLNRIDRFLKQQIQRWRWSETLPRHRDRSILLSDAAER